MHIHVSQFNEFLYNQVLLIFAVTYKLQNLSNLWEKNIDVI